jgi:hypothetical protein
MLIIPATWEAEIRKIRVEANLGKKTQISQVRWYRLVISAMWEALVGGL